MKIRINCARPVAPLPSTALKPAPRLPSDGMAMIKPMRMNTMRPNDVSAASEGFSTKYTKRVKRMSVRAEKRPWVPIESRNDASRIWRYSCWGSSLGQAFMSNAVLWSLTVLGSNPAFCACNLSAALDSLGGGSQNGTLNVKSRPPKREMPIENQPPDMSRPVALNMIIPKIEPIAAPRTPSGIVACDFAAFCFGSAKIS
mmetsp:Transcript_38181/g.88062  ORF Transcript_38181/g.88062 Transcript_38181/m.88062 type:complete len:200 (-) Transcript_38181:547-1146(-)